MSNNQLAVISSMDDIERAAGSMQKSGYFTDAKDLAQCVTKILAGREMGFGPFASMTGIYIIQGRPSIGANLMASAVKSSGRYNYRVIELTDNACEIAYTENGQECGRSRFTIEDAKKAQTKNLDKFPRNMLFARAMSNGCRWFCPDVFNGVPTYTPEEMCANVNEAGDVIDMPVIIQNPTPPAKPVQEAVKPWASMMISLETAQTLAGSDKTKYWDMTDDQLNERAGYIRQSLAKNGHGPQWHDDLEMRLDTITAILEYRAN